MADVSTDGVARRVGNARAADRGLFVAVEGLAGAGKTTVVRSLERWLADHRIPRVVTREPGGTIVGEKIRQLVLEPSNSMNAWTEALLFEADRAETVVQVIGPAIAQGKVVVSDRSLYGTIAYQSFGRGIDLLAIDFITQVAMAGHYPDLVIVLDVAPEVASMRASRKGSGTRFDQEDDSFRGRVRRGYLWAAQRDGSKAVVIEASRPPEAVAADAIKAVADLLMRSADADIRPAR